MPFFRVFWWECRPLYSRKVWEWSDKSSRKCQKCTNWRSRVKIERFLSILSSYSKSLMKITLLKKFMSHRPFWNFLHPTWSLYIIKSNDFYQLVFWRLSKWLRRLSYFGSPEKKQVGFYFSLIPYWAQAVVVFSWPIFRSREFY